jgi:hypothetical protein
MFTRVMHSPSESHLKQLIDFLKYLNATTEWGLNYFRDNSMKYGMKFAFLHFATHRTVTTRTLFEALAAGFSFYGKAKAVLALNLDKHLMWLYQVPRLKRSGLVAHQCKALLLNNFWNNYKYLAKLPSNLWKTLNPQ